MIDFRLPICQEALKTEVVERGEEKRERGGRDPVGMEPLFERFLSESRGEWPDIDLDLPAEDKREQAIYSFFDRIDKAHEDEADALADAVSYRLENPNPSQLTPAQIDKEIDLTKQVLSKHLRHGYLMQNLAEEFGQFRPGPSREELNHMLNLPR
jgi:hypothetical protein